jgi:glycosyltransferase involved in cell wall biosynthesis
LESGVKILHLTPWQEPCGIAGYAADLIGSLKERGVVNDVHPLNRRGRLYPLAEEVQGELDRFVRQAREYDLVHVQHEFSFFGDYTQQLDRSIRQLGYLLGRLRRQGKPAVVTFHTEPDFLHPLRRIVMRPRGVLEALRGYQHCRCWRRWVRPHFGRSSRFAAIVHTARARAGLIESGFHPTRVHKGTIGVKPRLGNLKQLGRGQAKESLGYPPDTVLLSLFGFISAYKGHDLATAALRHLPPHYHLAIIGGPHPRGGDDASLDTVLKMAAEHPGLKDRLRVTGYVSPETIDHYHAATDVCLAPYRNFNLSASAGITWALTSGRPIVASKVPPFLELQDESDCLLLFTENAEHELAWQIQRLTGDARLQQELVENAAAYAERYSWDRVAAEVLGLYGTLLGKPLPLPGPPPRLRIWRAA